MSIQTVIATLKDNYTKQVEYFNNKLELFDHNSTANKHSEIRDSFLNQAVYVDKLNFYQVNLNKIIALEKMVNSGVLLSHQRTNLSQILGSDKQEKKSLLDILEFVNKLN